MIIQNMRIELGVSRSPMTYPFTIWHKCTTPTQFFPFWEYASDIKLELHDGIAPIPTARTGDQFIMEAFANFGCSPKQLRMLNLCRLFLQIYLLSDLTTGDGELSCTFRTGIPKVMESVTDSGLFWPEAVTTGI